MRDGEQRLWSEPGTPRPAQPPPPPPPPGYATAPPPPPPGYAMAPGYRTQVADPADGKAVQVVGYVMACASIVLPLLGIAGLILGIITATKPRRGGHGAAIICLSVVLAIIGWILWVVVLANSAGPGSPESSPA